MATLDKTFGVPDGEMFVQQRNTVLFVGGMLEEELTDWYIKVVSNNVIDEACSISQGGKRIVCSWIVHD